MSVPVYYVIYGCLTAAIFETAAKFIGLKFLIKEPTSPGFALQFGIGYGISEAVLVGVLPLASNLATALQINKMGYDNYLQALIDQGADSATIEAFKSNIGMLYEENLTCLLSGIERVAAVALQIALTIIVFQAVKEGRTAINYAFVALAVVLHAIFDAPAAMYQVEMIGNITLIEIVIAIEAVIIAIVAYFIYKKNVKEFGQPVNAQSDYNK